jgi:hypothetical protein
MATQPGTKVQKLPAPGPTDFVVTYIAYVDGTVDSGSGYDALMTALGQGYRVLDVFVAPVPPSTVGLVGGTVSSGTPAHDCQGHTAVTVVLTNDSATPPPFYDPHGG